MPPYQCKCGDKRHRILHGVTDARPLGAAFEQCGIRIVAAEDHRRCIFGRKCTHMQNKPSQVKN